MSRSASVKIASIARDMLDGTINYLVGAYQLASLRHEVDAYANDPDFMPFVAILSEIDSLGFHIPPDKWSDKLIEENRAAIDESASWAKAISLQQCQSLVDRYSSAE